MTETTLGHRAAFWLQHLKNFELKHRARTGKTGSDFTWLRHQHTFTGGGTSAVARYHVFMHK